MILCLKKSNIVSLPEQEKMCSKPGTVCRYVEVKISFTNWEKRLAFFTQDENGTTKILIYKKPLCGNIYTLQSTTKLEVKKNSDTYFVKIRTENGKLEMKIDGKEAPLWVAAIISADFSNLTHGTHKISCSVESATQNNQSSDKNPHFELKDKSEEIYTGSRQGYVKTPATEIQEKPTVETKAVNDTKGKETPRSRKSHESKKESGRNKKTRTLTLSDEKKRKLNKTQTLSVTEPVHKQLEPSVFEDNTIGDVDPKLLPEIKNSDVDTAEGDEKKKGPDPTPANKKSKNTETNRLSDGKTQSDEGSFPNAKSAPSKA